jgi:hypothetical protein
MEIEREYTENGYNVKEYSNGTVIKTLIVENVQVEIPKPLTLEEINSKLDDITLLMLTQGGIIA